MGGLDTFLCSPLPREKEEEDLDERSLSQSPEGEIGLDASEPIFQEKELSKKRVDKNTLL